MACLAGKENTASRTVIVAIVPTAIFLALVVARVRRRGDHPPPPLSLLGVVCLSIVENIVRQGILCLLAVKNGMGVAT